MMAKNNKILGGILVLIISISVYFLLPLGNGLLSEFQNKRIDAHNFEQLEKIKEILAKQDTGKLSFDGLSEFNNKFNSNITSKRNCLYISSYNGQEDYIVGFQLESNEYIGKYGDKLYAYPRYDIEPQFICNGNNCDSDILRDTFERTITTPCE